MANRVRDSAVIQSEIDEVSIDIKDFQSQVRKADAAVEEATRVRNELRETLRKLAKKLKSPDLTEQERAELVADQQFYDADLAVAEKDLEPLRKKEEQLRRKEEQLRKKEEQLREEKLRLDASAAARGVASMTVGAPAALLGTENATGAGAAAGVGTTSAGDAGAAAGLRVGSAAGAGSLPAAAVSGGLGVRQTAGVAAGQSLGGTADADDFADLFTSALYCMTFTLYDGVDVAMRLVSHAKANGFRGEVWHMSTSRSDFTLLLDTNEETSKQTFKSFVRWLATQVPLRFPGAEASKAFAKAAEEDAARVEMTSDPFHPLTRDGKMLDMYNQGPITAYGTSELQLALEKANTVAEQRERLGNSSLGKSRASSSYAE